MEPPISSERFRRRDKVRRSVEYLRCYRHGVRRHGSLLTLYFHPNEEMSARLGITASRKVGKAVVRERLKRRVREIFRRSTRRAELPPMDIVVHLRPGAGEAAFGALRSELEELLAGLPPAGHGRSSRAEQPVPPPRRGTS